MRLVRGLRARPDRTLVVSSVPRAILTLALLALVVGASAGPTGAASGRTVLPGSVPAWANSHNYPSVPAEGTVAQAASAFGPSFGMYSFEGLTVRSPASDISIPDSLAGI